VFESYPRYEWLLASSQLVFAMLGMGVLLSPRDFFSIVREPRGLLLGFATQLATVPLVAALLGWILPLPVGIAAGLVLVAAVPGGTLSNIVTYLGRGNIALSISLTAITTVAALATTPLLLGVLIGAHMPPEFEMPVGRVAFEIGVTLLTPLVIGMLIGARLHNRRTFSRVCIRISIGIILMMAVGAGGSGRLDPKAYGVLAPLSIFILAFAMQQAAKVTTRLARLDPPDGLAIGVEVTIRNTNLALLVKASLFPATVGAVDPVGDGMFFVALLYGGVALLVAAPPVILNRLRAAPAP
jgi:BASS family bile acid:Na+ symporter